MQRIFVLSALVMASSVVLNALLPELPLRSRAEHVPPPTTLTGRDPAPENTKRRVRHAAVVSTAPRNAREGGGWGRPAIVGRRR